MGLNHPETIPLNLRFVGKTVFHETGPQCRKCQGPLWIGRRSKRVLGVLVSSSLCRFCSQMVFFHLLINSG